MPLTMLKMAVVAPIPMARITNVITVNTGARLSRPTIS